jgi:hypothetical protein
VQNAFIAKWLSTALSHQLGPKKKQLYIQNHAQPTPPKKKVAKRTQNWLVAGVVY